LLEEVLPEKEAFDDFEVAHTFQDIGQKIMLLNARQIYRENISAKMILLAIEDVTLRRKLEEAHNNLAAIVESADDAIIGKDLEGIIVSWNRGAEIEYGYNAKEVIGKSISLLMPPGHHDEYKELLIKRSSGELIKNYETQRRRKDGKIVDVSLTISPVEDISGENTGDSIIARDITERKRLESLLEESEERYRRLFETASDGIVLLEKREGKITHANPATEKMLGYTKKDSIGHSLQNIGILLDTGDFPMTLQNLNKIGIIKYDDVPIETKSGQHIDADIYLVDRARLVQCNIRDITERKQSEEALKQSEERYRSIFENAQEGIFRSTPDGKIIMSNQAMANMFGYESTEKRKMMTSTTDMVRQHYVNPEDLRQFEKTIEEHGFIKGYEAENYKKDGSIIWISLTMHAVHDEKGQIMHNDGIILDITNRKLEVERIKMALGATVQAIAVTVETRDPYTAGHQRRVANLARAIATEMNLSVNQIDGISMAAAIHDIGKISVPAEILSKPTKLTNIEFSLIKTHSQSGHDILKNIDFPWPVAKIVLEHHERMNGSGYPHGLMGTNILLESRIIAVADVVEAMGSHRPYRPSLGIEAALEEIERNKGTFYDNTVTDACLRLFRGKGYQLAGA
jgi:PAS domain S-box-containing protein